MCSSNPTTDGAPEPCSAGLAGASLVHPVEPLEQVRQVGSVDPDPGIAYRDDHGVPSELTRHDDLTLRGYEFHYVVNEYQEQPFEEIGITFKRHALRR